MTLQQFIKSKTKISYENLGLMVNRDLVIEIQTKLSALGIIDPPADGELGPISLWGIDTFKKLVKISPSLFIDKDFAEKLVAATVDKLLPLKPAKNLAGRIINYMLKKGYWIARVPNCVNIVYVEGMNENAILNNDKFNVFNDLRIVIMINSKGVPYIKGMWVATTEPGKHYTENPMDSNGAARVKFGQYRAWGVGIHNGEKGHEALRQVKPIDVHRDLDKDGRRAGDEIYTGIFGINQHWGYDNPISNIGRASAGCLVGRTVEGHKAFMKIVKSDPKYKVNNRYSYFTTVVAGDSPDLI